MQTLIVASLVSLVAMAGELPPPTGAVFGLEPGQTVQYGRDPDGRWRAINSESVGAGGTEPPSQVSASDSVTFTFKAEPTIGGMMLIVRNKSVQAFTYEAIIVKGQDRPQRTSVCVVQPGLVTYESWPYTFGHIYFGNLKLIDAARAPLDCK